MVVLSCNRLFQFELLIWKKKTMPGIVSSSTDVRVGHNKFIVQARIHCEIFLSEHFMKYVFLCPAALMFESGITNLLFRRGYTVKYFFQSISWNTYFTIVSLCKLLTNIHDILFEAFREKVFLWWKTFLLNLFSCLINSFIINDILM